MVGFLEACAAAAASEIAKTPDAQLHAQELSSLTKIVAAWPKLSAKFRTAVLAVTLSAFGRPEVPCSGKTQNVTSSALGTTRHGSENE
jgi:hypothetical protein